jgi:hypothetical protein
LTAERCGAIAFDLGSLPSFWAKKLNQFDRQFFGAAAAKPVDRRPCFLLGFRDAD